MRTLTLATLLLTCVPALAVWDRFDLETDEWIEARGRKPVVMPSGARIASTAPAERLAEFGWLERAPFTAPEGEVRTGAPAYTPDWDALQSIQTYDTITEAEAEAARQAAKDARRKQLENEYVDMCKAAGFDRKVSVSQLFSIVDTRCENAAAAGDDVQYHVELRRGFQLLLTAVRLHALSLETNTDDIPEQGHTE